MNNINANTTTAASTTGNAAGSTTNEGSIDRLRHSPPARRLPTNHRILLLKRACWFSGTMGPA
jgi:hypothetical protein